MVKVELVGGWKGSPQKQKDQTTDLSPHPVHLAASVRHAARHAPSCL